MISTSDFGSALFGVPGGDETLAIFGALLVQWQDEQPIGVNGSGERKPPAGDLFESCLAVVWNITNEHKRVEADADGSFFSGLNEPETEILANVVGVHRQRAEECAGTVFPKGDVGEADGAGQLIAAPGGHAEFRVAV